MQGIAITARPPAHHIADDMKKHAMKLAVAPAVLLTSV